MKFLKYIYFLILLLIISKPSSASDVGCSVGNTIYTNQVPPGLLGLLLGGVPGYDNDAPVVVDPQCTTYRRSCKVCLTGVTYNILGVIVGTGCAQPWTDGSEVNYVLSCPLDSYPIALLLIGSSIGAFSIYKKNRLWS